MKTIFDLSDVDVVERSKYDMSFKYFLGMAPEEEVINPSSLTKFRKSVYNIDESLKSKFPAKVNNGLLEDEIEYCQNLIKVIKDDVVVSNYPSVKEKINLLQEAVDDDLEQLALSKDEDAKIGHKTADTSFFGYKTHITMNEERIITAAVVTSGEKHDGKQLAELIEQSKTAGIDVKDVIGDAAYSEKDNIELTKEQNIHLISKLSKSVTHGNRKNQNNFEYNKDAGMYVCKAGHMAIRKARQGKKNTGTNQTETYYFNIEKYKRCPQRDGCYKEGAKSKTYSVTIKSNAHKEQAAFQESEYFKEKSKERYKIEAKNSELKHRHGFDVASSSGLIGIEMQGALTIFAVNLKRIISLTK